MMSNFNKFLMGGGSKKGGKPKEEAPVEKPKPPSMPPLTDTQAATRQVDLSDVAKADAEDALDEARTVEVPIRAPKAPPSPVPSAVRAPPPKREAKVVQLSPKPSAPAAAEKKAEEAAPTGEAAEAEKPAPAPERKGIDTEGLLAKIKAQVEGLLNPVREQLAELSRKVEELGGKVDAADTINDSIVNELEGRPVYQTDEEGNAVIDDEGNPVQAVDEEGNPVWEAEDDGIQAIGIKRRLSGVEGMNDAIIAEIEGPEPQQDEEGNPVDAVDEAGNLVLGIKQRLAALEGALTELLGEGFERLPGMTQDNGISTAKNLVVALLGPTPKEDVEQLAVERGPKAVKSLLKVFSESEGFVVSIAANVKGVPPYALDYDENRDKKAEVLEMAAAIPKAVRNVSPELDWKDVEARHRDFAKPEAETNGGDE